MPTTAYQVRGSMTYYNLLEIAPSAGTGEIKKAFRRLIARYHPDKVQHLGDEFQAIAEKRSAELTIAYKTLVDPERRAAYDESLSTEPAVAAADAPGHHAGADAGVAPAEGPAPARDPSFASLRTGRDAMIRRAALARLETAIDGAYGRSDRAPVAGFDLSYFHRPRLLERSPRPWVLSRFVPRLDATALRDIFRDALRASHARNVAVCVFALSPEVASDRELADAIAATRHQQNGARRVTIVPVDAGDWRAWVPTDADPAVRSVAARLRSV
jgi:curved DNA-binding protein CbpA